MALGFDYSHYLPPKRVSYRQEIVQPIPVVITPPKKRGPRPQIPYKLTDRQFEIIKMQVVDGMTKKQIAASVDRSIKTIEKHTTDAYKLTGSHCYVDMLKWLFRNNFLTLEEFLK